MTPLYDRQGVTVARGADGHLALALDRGAGAAAAPVAATPLGERAIKLTWTAPSRGGMRSCVLQLLDLVCKFACMVAIWVQNRSAA